jgi:hypothetical protein
LLDILERRKGALALATVEVVLDLMLLAIRLRVQEAIADATFPTCIAAAATMALHLHMSHTRCLALEIRRAGVAFERRSNMTCRDAMVVAGVLSGVIAGVEALAASAALVIHGHHRDFGSRSKLGEAGVGACNAINGWEER